MATGGMKLTITNRLVPKAYMVDPFGFETTVWGDLIIKARHDQGWKILSLEFREEDRHKFNDLIEEKQPPAPPDGQKITGRKRA